MTNSLTVLHFLGTGGGRFTMTTQRRRTAGIRILEGDTQVHIDPGPGAIVFSNWAGLSPDKLDGIIVTHCHPDHYTDAEVLIEAMTRGTTAKRGVLAASKSVFRGGNGIGPAISSYHQSLVREIIELSVGTRFKVGDLGFTAVKAKHNDPFNIGLRVKTSNGAIGYTSDTGYFSGISDNYRGLRVLILCTMWPRGRTIEAHLNTDDACRILEEAQPEACILTHFGMRMLNAGPEREAEYLTKHSGVPVYAAVDGLRMTLGNSIELKGLKKGESIEIK